MRFSRVVASVLAVLLVVLMATPSGAIVASKVELRLQIKRANHKLSFLAVKPRLEECAQAEAKWIVRHGYLDHGHSGCGQTAEIIGIAPDLDSIITAWMQSPDHRAIILSKTLHRIGCARVRTNTTYEAFAYACEFT